ncbi:leucine-rich repeat-containing protein 17 [Alosa sapidissima]|uniref:leucine-rich repeat-containing protein 17 n=1 Tax=Alosa sapidissima TaxID=34773 RepID=UPI001C09CC64|nr:leucine-rich repeat-containing protein 17 [Alosa sapidissima]XP_041942044.1 leucine-rich repeat-containing protein 17 [Alosa sapidissima]
MGFFRVLVVLLVLLVVGGAERRRGGGGRRGLVRGRGRAGAVKRLAEECKQYVEAGETYLDCQDRGLTSIPPGWPEDTQHLLLARNRLQVLRDGTFAHLKQLRSLDLQQNWISRVEDGAFAGLDQLHSLLLQNNRLRSLSEEPLTALPRLRYLRLYSNPWACDCQLDSLVRTLQVPSNRQLGNFAKCEEPEQLRGHKLKKLKADLLCEAPPPADPNAPPTPPGHAPHPPAIRKPQDATSLCHTYLVPRPLLDCTSRDLKYVPADIPPDIVNMDMSTNSIQRLRPRDFATAKDLKTLNLSSNSLESIDTAAFAGLLYLRELDLSNNSLQFFQYGVLEDLYFLKRLSLGGNPWRCDYSIHYLVYWLKHHPGVAHSGLVCSEPQEYLGWPVEDYVKTYNADCPKDRQVGGGNAELDKDAANQDTAQELKAETDEEAVGVLPSPLRMRKTFEIIRLS